MFLRGRLDVTPPPMVPRLRPLVQRRLKAGWRCPASEGGLLACRGSRWLCPRRSRLCRERECKVKSIWHVFIDGSLRPTWDLLTRSWYGHIWFHTPVLAVVPLCSLFNGQHTWQFNPISHQDTWALITSSIWPTGPESHMSDWNQNSFNQAEGERAYLSIDKTPAYLSIWPSVLDWQLQHHGERPESDKMWRTNKRKATIRAGCVRRDNQGTGDTKSHSYGPGTKRLRGERNGGKTTKGLRGITAQIVHT